MERFQGDYDSMVQSHCMRVFGLPESQAGKDKRFIGLESFPRVAEVYIQGMSKVSYDSILNDFVHFLNRFLLRMTNDLGVCPKKFSLSWFVWVNSLLIAPMKWLIVVDGRSSGLILLVRVFILDGWKIVSYLEGV